MPKAGQVAGKGLDFGAAARELVNPGGNDRQRLLSRGEKPKDFSVANKAKIDAMLEKGRERRLAAELRTQSPAPESRRPASSLSALGSRPPSTARTALYTPKGDGRIVSKHIHFDIADDASPASTQRPATATSSSRPSSGASRNDSSYLSGETTLNESAASAGEIILPLSSNSWGGSGEPGEILVLDRADDLEWERPRHAPVLGLNIAAAMASDDRGFSRPSAHSSSSARVKAGGKARDQAFKTTFLDNNRYQVHFTSTGIPYTSCHSPRVSRLRDADADSRLSTSHSSRPRSAAPAPTSHRAGSVPKYLQERKRELEAEKEEQRRAAAIPKVPLGMRIVPEWEQGEAARRLKTEVRRLEGDLAAMPLSSSHTPSHRTRMEGLERLMREAERKLSLVTATRAGPLFVPNWETLMPQVAPSGGGMPFSSEGQRIRFMQSNPSPF